MSAEPLFNTYPAVTDAEAAVRGIVADIISDRIGTLEQKSRTEATWACRRIGKEIFDALHERGLLR